jgi:hypothetical protein
MILIEYCGIGWGDGVFGGWGSGFRECRGVGKNSKYDIINHKTQVEVEAARLHLKLNLNLNLILLTRKSKWIKRSSFYLLQLE